MLVGRFSIAPRASGWIVSPWISVPAWILTAVLGIWWLILHFHHYLPKIHLVWPEEESARINSHENDDLNVIINDLKREAADLRKQLESKQTDELEEEIIGLLVPGASFDPGTIAGVLGITLRPDAEKLVRIALARMFKNGIIEGSMGSFVKLTAHKVTKQ